MSPTKSGNPYKVFHSPWEELRRFLHIVLVAPEHGGNVGAIARAMANMGIEGDLRIVGAPNIIDDEARKFAVHSQDILDKARHFETLDQALGTDPCLHAGTDPGSESQDPGFRQPGPVPDTRGLGPVARVLSLAATSDIGSAKRPHPMRVEDAVPKAIEKLKTREIPGVCFVFGSESNGLTNAEIERCDWVVTIPATAQYRSLNLAQAVLIFSYEANQALLTRWEEFETTKPGQKERLIGHLLELAEAVGFILPGDPLKMRPRLEGIFSKLPRFIEEGSTLHGLIDQTIRSVRKGEADVRGRYKYKTGTPPEEGLKQ